MTPLALFGILLKILIVVGITQGAVSYLIWVERKVAAYSQDRIGPNRCGTGMNILGRTINVPFGLIQPLADGAKLLLKEDVVPRYVNKPLYILAPMIAMIAAMIGFAVVPFGAVGMSAPRIPGGDYTLQFQIAPGVDVGIVYIFAIGSLAVYGVILGGWASNNKYSFLGGMRSSAQIISYEIPLGMSILGMVLIAGSLDLNTIVESQHYKLFGFIPRWGILIQPIGFILFVVSAFAETNRLPFDLPESEQELVGGYHTEYSGMKFGLFFLGEYLHVITVSYMTVALFLGGWDIPGITPVAPAGGFWTLWVWALVKMSVMAFKVALMILFMMWIRWTIPRFRYDQLMDLAWKNLIPLALVNLLATALVVQLIRS
jgi:NADH-quinone oxidoreductase subunit H